MTATPAPKPENALGITMELFQKTSETDGVPDYSGTSIFPAVVVTGFELGAGTVEMRKRENIADTSMATKNDSGEITYPTVSINVNPRSNTPALLNALNAFTGEPDLECNLVITKNAGGANSCVLFSGPVLPTEDLTLSATAKQKFTGALKFQVNGEFTRGS